MAGLSGSLASYTGPAASKKPPDKPRTHTHTHTHTRTHTHTHTMKTSLSSRRAAYARAKALLLNAKNISNAAHDVRQFCAKAWGACEGPNRFPISGGICAHWPNSAKDAVTSLVREANAALDESFAEWKAAGCRRGTWMREKEGVFGPGTTVL